MHNKSCNPNNFITKSIIIFCILIFIILLNLSVLIRYYVLYFALFFLITIDYIKLYFSKKIYPSYTVIKIFNNTSQSILHKIKSAPIWR